MHQPITKTAATTAAGKLLLYPHTIQHHPLDIAHRFNIGQRISVDYTEVRQFTLFNGTNAFINP